MLLPRIIPLLLIDGRRLLKTQRFSDARYIGDPINAVRIFNDKEVDELLIIDIGATTKTGPNFDVVREIVSEAFMPVCYGGGVRTLAQMERLFGVGIEKISLGFAASHLPGLIGDAVRQFGRQSVVACIDVKRSLFGGPNVTVEHGRTSLGIRPADFARACEDAGAGEILLQSVDRDGTRHGFDLQLVKDVTMAVSVPVIACGGAASLIDLGRVIHEAGASAAAAGSIFVFHGKLDAVLISYPPRPELEKLVGKLYRAGQ
jgi:imidazole glycerol-phosphate synthase subunit HisF